MRGRGRCFGVWGCSQQVECFFIPEKTHVNLWVGNKFDLNKQRVGSMEQAQKFANEWSWTELLNRVDLHQIEMILFSGNVIETI